MLVVVLMSLLVACSSLQSSEVASSSSGGDSEVEQQQEEEATVYSRLLVTFDPLMIASKNVLAPENSHTIAQYFLSVVESVNRRFATISQLKLHHIVQDLYEWHDMPKYIRELAGRRYQYDGDVMLSTFNKYFPRSTTSQHDVMILFTNRILFRRTGNQYQRHTAFVVPGQACPSPDERTASSRKIQIVVEDHFGTYSAVVAVTRALATLYGCPKDGSGHSQSCDPDDLYVMGNHDGGRNNFFFSPCSQKVLADNLRKFRDDDGCFNGTADDLTFPKTLLPYPGQRVLAIEEQCAAILAQKVDTYDQVDGKDLCEVVECRKGGGTVVGTVSAYEGTPCDAEKVCWYGRCMDSHDVDAFDPRQEAEEEGAEEDSDAASTSGAAGSSDEEEEVESSSAD